MCCGVQQSVSSSAVLIVRYTYISTIAKTIPLNLPVRKEDNDLLAWKIDLFYVVVAVSELPYSGRM